MRTSKIAKVVDATVMTEIVDTGQLRIGCTREVDGSVDPGWASPKTVQHVVGIPVSADDNPCVIDGKRTRTSLTTHGCWRIDRDKCSGVRTQESAKYPVRVSIVAYDVAFVVHPPHPGERATRRHDGLELV